MTKKLDLADFQVLKLQWFAGRISVKAPKSSVVFLAKQEESVSLNRYNTALGSSSVLLKFSENFTSRKWGTGLQVQVWKKPLVIR